MQDGMDPDAGWFVPESEVEVCKGADGQTEQLGKGGFGVVRPFFATSGTLRGARITVLDCPRSMLGRFAAVWSGC